MEDRETLERALAAAICAVDTAGDRFAEADSAAIIAGEDLVWAEAALHDADEACRLADEGQEAAIAALRARIAWENEEKTA